MEGNKTQQALLDPALPLSISLHPLYAEGDGSENLQVCPRPKGLYNMVLKQHILRRRRRLLWIGERIFVQNPR